MARIEQIPGSHSCRYGVQPGDERGGEDGAEAGVIIPAPRQVWVESL